MSQIDSLQAELSEASAGRVAAFAEGADTATLRGRMFRGIFPHHKL